MESPKLLVPGNFCFKDEATFSGMKVAVMKEAKV